jgi:hypothetical protein
MTWKGDGSATRRIGSVDLHLVTGPFTSLVWILAFLGFLRYRTCLNDDDISVYFVCACTRIFAPTTYIFFASAIPVISFGEQLDRDTSKRCLHCDDNQLLWSGEITLRCILFPFLFCSLYMELSLLCLTRWTPHSSTNVGIHIIVWDSTLAFWWATASYSRRGRTDGYHVYVHVQLCERSKRDWTETFPGLDWMVRNGSMWWMNHLHGKLFSCVFLNFWMGCVVNQLRLVPNSMP